MVPTFKEYAFDFAELKLISIVCKKCKSEIILDVMDINFRTPRACPSCREEFASLFTDALNSFHSAYSNFTRSENASARIRIRREVNLPEF